MHIYIFLSGFALSVWLHNVCSLCSHDSGDFEDTGVPSGPKVRRWLYTASDRLLQLNVQLVFQGLSQKQFVNIVGAPRSVALILGIHQNLMKHPIITHRGALPGVRAHVAACVIVIYSPCVCLKCVTESHKTERTIKENSWSRFFGSLAGCLEDLGIYPQIDQTAFVVCKVSNCHSHDPSSQICKPITKSAHFQFYIYLLWDSTVTYSPLFCVITASHMTPK